MIELTMPLFLAATLISEDTEQKKHHRKATPDVIAEITNQENPTDAKPVVCHLPASFFEWKKKKP